MTVGFGVIGCGGIGLSHVKRLLQIEEAEVRAGCDVNLERRETFGEQTGLPGSSLHRDYRELLKRDDVDAVVIGLPNRLHSPVTVEAFEAGKHVYCEKPMATSLVEAQAMVDAAERSGGKLLVGVQSRFRGDVQALKRRVDRGVLGNVYYAKCAWMRRSGLPGWGSWFTRREDAGAGPIYDIGVHVLDLTFWLMDNFRPASAFASSYAKFGPSRRGLSGWGTHHEEGFFDVEDLATALLRMEGGASVAFEVSWVSHIEKPRIAVELMGIDGGLNLESATIYSTEEGSHVDSTVHFEEVDVYLASMKHFVECIQEDGAPMTKPEEMLGLQRALDMILKSATEDRLVTAGEV
jgi:predicted dehydrogenase